MSDYRRKIEETAKRIINNSYYGDFGELDRALDRKTIKDYLENESWNNMGGS